MVRILLIIFIGFSFGAKGAVSKGSSKKNSTSQKSSSSHSLRGEAFFIDKDFFEKRKDSYFRIYTESLFYVSPKSHPEQANTYVHVGGEFQTKKEYRYLFYDAHAYAQASLDNSQQHYLSVSEGNIGFQLKNIRSIPTLNFIGVSVGRYKKQWSWIDSYWHLGLWNPQNLYDYFNPVEMGIVGSALVLEGDSWSLTSLAGNIFFPNQQPSIISNEREDSTFKSRWQTPPQSSIWIFNRTIDMHYWLDEPYRKNVLFQSSYLVRLLFGGFDDKWISFSYAHKPLNQIYFRVRSGLSLENITMNSFIHYHALKHHLSTVESGFQLGPWKIYLGIVDERLGDIDLPANWLTPPLPNAVFASASIGRSLDFVSFNSNFIRFSYLTSWFRGINNRSLIAGDLESMMSMERFKMQEGLSVSWKSLFSFKKRKIISLLKYWYSMDQKGGWLQWKLSYHFDLKSQIYFECDVLGTDDLDSSGFFGKYAGNDRVSMGVQYVF